MIRSLGGRSITVAALIKAHGEEFAGQGYWLFGGIDDSELGWPLHYCRGSD